MGEEGLDLFKNFLDGMDEIHYWQELQNFRWVDILREGRPDSTGWYLVFMLDVQTGYVQGWIGKLDEDLSTWYIPGYSKNDEFVITHWTPFPVPPKG